MKYYVLLIYACIFIALPHLVSATRVNSLYQAHIPVSTQSAEERIRILPQALAQVIVKVSGSSQVLNNPNIKSQLNQASKWMQEFGYQSNNNANKPYVVEIRFDSEGINALLRNAAVPIWGANRPLILIWIESQAPQQATEIIGAESSSEWQIEIKQRADQRGLPIIFPMMDVDDLSLVTPNDVATMNIPVLQSAAKRYASNAMLVAHVIHSSDGLIAEARFVLNGAEQSWKVSGNTLADISTTLINNVADSIASQSATIVTNAVQDHFTLEIRGISQQDDFTHLMEYLHHLPPIAALQIERISGSDVMLTVSLRGTRTSLTQVLAAGNKLRPDPGELNGKLIYQWNH